MSGVHVLLDELHNRPIGVTWPENHKQSSVSPSEEAQAHLSIIPRKSNGHVCTQSQITHHVIL